MRRQNIRINANVNRHRSHRHARRGGPIAGVSRPVQDGDTQMDNAGDPEMLARSLVTAAALTMAATAAAQSLEVRPINGTRLDVVATGQVTRVPDIVSISVGIQTDAATASEAIRANGASVDQLRQALGRAGIAPRDVQTQWVNLDARWTHRSNGPPIFAGYRVDHWLNVRFRDVANAGRILDTLVAAGATEIDGPNFEFADAGAAQDEARLAALAAARGRADLYAGSLGMRVVRVLSVSEVVAGRPVNPALRQTNSANAPATNIALGEESIGLGLTVSFELE